MSVYLTVLLAVLNQIGLKGSKMLVALYAIDLHATPFTIGLLISMYAIFPLLLAVYAGRYSDRVGMRRPIMLGSIGLCAGLLTPTFYPALIALFISAALVGTAHIFCHVAMHNLIGALGGPEQRTANFGTFSLGSAVSGMVGPMLVGFMVDRAGYVPTYYVLAAITMVPFLFLLCWRSFMPPPSAHRTEAASGGVLELLKIPKLRNTLLTSGVILTGLDLFNFYMPIHGRSIGLSASAIGVILGMQAAAAFVVRLWMPRMSRKYGEMRVLTWSLLMAGVTFLLFPAFRDPVVLAAISFLLGLALGCGQPLSTILTYNHSPPGRSGEALGMRLTGNKFTQIMVPLVFGSLGSAFGIYPIFWSSAALLLCGGYNNARHEKSVDPAPATALKQLGD
ncbi:MAG: transporter [Massilia sp.]|nr:transporter [Massilia sp.]